MATTRQTPVGAGTCFVLLCLILATSVAFVNAGKTLSHRCRGWLVLDDGSIYAGESVGACNENEVIMARGEAVFITGMTGYVETLTDPSFSNQFVTFTYPLMGNYGVIPGLCPKDVVAGQPTKLCKFWESTGIAASGVLMSKYSEHPSHWQSGKTLGAWLQEQGVIGLSGIDTRTLTEKIANLGSIGAVLIVDDRPLKAGKSNSLLEDFPYLSPKDAAALLPADSPVDYQLDVNSVNLVALQSTDKPFIAEMNYGKIANVEDTKMQSSPTDAKLGDEDELKGVCGERGRGACLRLLVMDFGIKHAILRSLHNRGRQISNGAVSLEGDSIDLFAKATPEQPGPQQRKTDLIFDLEVKVLPWDTDFPSLYGDDVEHERFDGILLSNGPGDPAVMTTVVENVKYMLKRSEEKLVPVMGICLGFQLMSLAIGGECKKMKRGHRGHNQPVMDEVTGHSFLTSQNHGYECMADKLPSSWLPMFTNLNDQTLEGIIHETKPFFAVQFHPEASGGPVDMMRLFDLFIIQSARHMLDNLPSTKKSTSTGSVTKPNLPDDDSMYDKLKKISADKKESEASSSVDEEQSVSDAEGEEPANPMSPKRTLLSRNALPPPATLWRQIVADHRYFAPGVEHTPVKEYREATAAYVKKVQSYKRIMILGSGATEIGQAGEFDYSGVQAIKALKEKGLHIILVNPNVASVQTAKGFADEVYFVPLRQEYVQPLIESTKPDGLLLSFGGQTALNLGLQLKEAGILEKFNVAVMGTSVESIAEAEDRDLFKDAMISVGHPVAKSRACSDMDCAIAAANDIGYPLIIRAAFALGGLGSGFVDDEVMLSEMVIAALTSSPQVLVEQSIKGWKEVEYEVLRDVWGNSMIVCNMENFDPVGVHTGESIVVCPSQTLTNQEYYMLRTAALEVVERLKIIGECNIQFALHPTSLAYVVIEVNPRLSRSSALASKASGYPIAHIAAKLILGESIYNIKNFVTGDTSAFFEPSLDYIVVKIPRWDFAKFQSVNRKLGTSMKSIGEVMGIDRRFSAALQKAIRMTSPERTGLDAGTRWKEATVEVIKEEILHPTEQRVFAIVAALERGLFSVEEVADMSKIDKWFLYSILETVTHSNAMTKAKAEGREDHFIMPGDDGMPRPASKPLCLSFELLVNAKVTGFSDTQIAERIGRTWQDVRAWRTYQGLRPHIRKIDTSAGEFPAKTNYLYRSYESIYYHISRLVQAQHPMQSAPQRRLLADKKTERVMVLGSGVYHVGSSVEYDYSTVMSIRTARRLGYGTVVINFNPETLSTDYDESDRLYFEELSLESVLDVFEYEQQPKAADPRYTHTGGGGGMVGVFVSMGGQIPNGLAIPLQDYKIPVLGTDPSSIDKAENRAKHSAILDELGVSQPQWAEASSVKAAEEFAARVGYPVLVRPSYVLSGSAMRVVYSQEKLAGFLDVAAVVNPDKPVVVSQYVEGAQEIDMDAVAFRGELLSYSIAQHVEKAGVHSGDSTLILPAPMLDPRLTTHTKARADLRRILKDILVKIAKNLEITGPFNVQVLAKIGQLTDDHTEIVLPSENSQNYVPIEETVITVADVKVIETNLRAARSIPFVSKVLGIDFAIISTEAIMALHEGKTEFVSSKYEMSHADITEHCDNQYRVKLYGVKTATFSFKRLIGSDPLTHVAMTSTGEVACMASGYHAAFMLSMVASKLLVPKHDAKGQVLLAMHAPTSLPKQVREAGIEAVRQLIFSGYTFTSTAEVVKLFADNSIKVTPCNCEHPLEMLNEASLKKHPINMMWDISRGLEKKDIKARQAAVGNNIPLITDVDQALLLAQSVKIIAVDLLPLLTPFSSIHGAEPFVPLKNLLVAASTPVVTPTPPPTPPFVFTPPAVSSEESNPPVTGSPVDPQEDPDAKLLPDIPQNSVISMPTETEDETSSNEDDTSSVEAVHPGKITVIDDSNSSVGSLSTVLKSAVVMVVMFFILRYFCASKPADDLFGAPTRLEGFAGGARTDNSSFKFNSNDSGSPSKTTQHQKSCKVDSNPGGLPFPELNPFASSNPSGGRNHGKGSHGFSTQQDTDLLKELQEELGQGPALNSNLTSRKGGAKADTSTGAFSKLNFSTGTSSSQNPFAYN